MKYFLLVLPFLFLGACGGDNNGMTRDEIDSTKFVDSMWEQSPLNKNKTATPIVPVRIFYWNMEERINQDIPVDTSKDAALKIMKELPVVDGNYFGMMRGEEEIVQFMHTDDKGLLLDIPNAADGPFQTVITIDQCLKVISDFYDGKSDDAIANQYSMGNISL